MTLRLPLLLSFAFAGAAFADVAVNGVAVSAGASGDGWTYEAPEVRLTAPGPFVVSGLDSSGGTVLRAEADATVVVSNLLLLASETGVRSRTDDPALAYSAATNGSTATVAAFADGLYFADAALPAPLLPDDPAAADGMPFLRNAGWTRSNVSWGPAWTNFTTVLWTGERFVAARFLGGFLYSEAHQGLHGGPRYGEFWEKAEWDGNPVNLRALARGGADGGTLVAASTRGLWTSRDGGRSWTQTTNLYANAVVWSDGVFVAVGELRGAAMEGVYWSADGEHWNARGFTDLPANLSFVVAGGGGRFLAGGAKGWHAMHLENGNMVSDGSSPVSATKFATAAGNGRYVACFKEGTGLRHSTNGIDWTRSDKQDGTFHSIVWKDGRFLAEGFDADGCHDGIWTSADGAAWTRAADEYERGLPALDCGAHDVKLVVAGTENRLYGGLYAPSVRVAPGGSLDVSAQSAAPAALDLRGGRLAAAVGGGVGEDAGAFVQHGATLFAVGGAYAPDIGPGHGGAAADGATILGGSLCPAGARIEPVPSNNVEAVRCVVVDGLAPGSAAEFANLPEGYGTDGIVADALGYVWLWLPASAEPGRFIADGSLRRVAAGGDAVVVETLPPPRIENVAFAPVATRGETAMEVKLRVSSPVEAEALAPVYASDLSVLSSGGGTALVPSRVEQLSADEYELTFRLPADAPSGFLVIQAK